MPKPAKKAVDLTLDSALLQAARAHDTNLSATLEAAVAARLRGRRRAEWLKKNAGAIDACNEDIATNGTFSVGLRSY